MSAPADPARAAELAQHYALCEAALREKDRDLWLAALFAPAARRRHLHALYAFALEIDDVRAKVTQPLLGEMRLRWWADTLAAPDAEGGAAHPVADAVKDAIAAHALSHEEVAAFIDAHVADLYDDPLDTMAALLAYCDATAGALLRWSARCLGAGEANAQANAQANAIARGALADAGAALALTRVLRRLPLGGGQFLPLELLARHGAPPQDARAGVDSAPLRLALDELRALAQARFEAARAGARLLDEATRTALLPAATVPLYLELMRRRDYNPFHPLVEPQPWRRQWRLWRAARAGL
jgi:phytoene synthase